MDTFIKKMKTTKNGLISVVQTSNFMETNINEKCNLLSTLKDEKSENQKVNQILFIR